MTGAARAGARSLVLDPADNVAVALADIAAGEVVGSGADAVTALEPIRAGHKLAIRPIGPDEAVVKYGEVIGRASAAIAAGDHVHVHNVSSGRLPGPDR
ncbi:MAG: UxaA family hydrolase [Solirubrobacteraceae bacterium]